MTRIRVAGRVDGTRGATIVIDRERELITVRPRGRRCGDRYTLPLSFVAEFVVTKVVKQELALGRPWVGRRRASGSGLTNSPRGE